MTTKKLEIKSESEFREQTGITGPIALDWAEGKIVESTQSALDSLKKSMNGKKVEEQRKLAEEFIAANEKKDAVDKLTERFGTNMLKNPKVLAIAGTAAAGVGVAVHALDKKVEEVTGSKMGFMDSIRDWLKEAADEETGFMKGFFMLLYKMMGGKKEKEDDEKPAAQISSIVEKIEDAKAQKIARQLFDQANKGKQEKLSPDTLVYFNHSKMLGMTFMEIGEMKNKYENNPVGLEKEFATEKIGVGKDILQAMSLIVGNEIYFQSFFANDLSWKTKPIKNTLIHTLSYVQFFSKLQDAKGNINFSGFSFGDVTEDLSKMAEEKKELLSTMQAKYAGCTPKVIGSLHNKYREIPLESKRDYSGTDFNQDEKEFLDKTLVEYGSKLQTFLIENFSFGEDKMLLEHFKSKPLNQADLIDFFILSGGSTDINGLNHLQHAFVCSKVFAHIRGGSDTGVIEGSNAYTYISAIAKALSAKESNIKIPAGIKTFMRDSIDLLVNGMMVGAKEVIMATLGVAKDNMVVTAAIVTAIGVIMYFGGGAVLALARGATLIHAAIMAALAGWGYSVLADDKVDKNNKMQIPKSEVDMTVSRLQSTLKK